MNFSPNQLAGQTRRWILVLAPLLSLAVGPGRARATENGTTAFPNGGEDLLVAAMPPPGWYSTLYLNRYSAGRLVDGSGGLAAGDFRLTVDAVTPRLDWVKPASVLGSDRWGTLVVMPWLDLDLRLSPAPDTTLRGSRRGWGDLTVGNGLHWTLGRFELVNAFDVVVPTGAYDVNALVNPGRNQWVLRLSTLGTWFPSPRWDVSYRFHWDDNLRNRDTGYRSGQTLYLNWAVGWKPTPATSAGLVGFFLRQITDDEAPSTGGNRLRASGIGPVLKRAGPGGVMLTVKYLRDFDVRNRPQGAQVWAIAAWRY